MLRWLTGGESHGPSVTGILEGLPAGIAIDREEVSRALKRRRLGYGRGARMKFETDAFSFVGGIRHGVTLGSPIVVRVENAEWSKWDKVMAAEPVAASELQGLARSAPLQQPRPGHADLAGMQKYGFAEARGVLERASARETVMRVALGAIAAAFLRELNVQVLSHTVGLGAVEIASQARRPTINDVTLLDADPLRCIDPEASRRMVAEVDKAHEEGETLGGIVEVLAYGAPPGLGSYVHWDRRLDARLAGALMSIPAIKGVEIGDGFRTASRRGSQAHDEMLPGKAGIRRVSNRAGGIEGGMSIGDLIRVRAAMKPISTLPRALRTVDITTGKAATAHHQRSDVCAVPAAGVVAEAMVTLILAQAVLEKFGGDSCEQTRANLLSYCDSIPQHMRLETEQ